MRTPIEHLEWTLANLKQRKLDFQRELQSIRGKLDLTEADIVNLEYYLDEYKKNGV